MLRSHHLTRVCVVVLVIATLGWLKVSADEKRAAPPQFSDKDLETVFFDKLTDAFRGERPSLSKVRKAAAATNVAADTAPAAGSNGGAAEGGNLWTKLITPVSLEDEVKRVKLHYDGVITTPSAFNSGGYQDARLDLTILATMFAVISEHEGDVRWKSSAAAARDILARTAFRCSSGSTQVYNEAKTRKADLQDLVSGSGLSGPASSEANDWSVVADRSPMMEYLDELKESLKGATNSESTVKDDPATARRNAELIAVVGEVLIQEGLDDADDKDYVAFSKVMTSAASDVTRAIELGDYDAVRKAVGAVTQSCDTCHDQYR
ncbi:cytochrome c [Stieleria varia]|uniref:Cytochrome C n=1 Tax=Stieleria varia TaxID=2528005 RepID=A0A5C6AFR7_9BACT|nr:cytochrome c [Stieleria varia]TWT98449.1 Cytochrome C' [Stieleria varia]